MGEDEVVDGADRWTRLGERLLEVAENAIYTLVAVLLVVAAVVLLGSAALELRTIPDGSDIAILALLDRLLLVFVLVELLFAVRMTLQRREIVAEPFLIVGIIASIKEIILLSVEVANVLEGKPTAGDPIRDPGEFAIIIGLLGVLVLVLASSALLLRLKERSPEEGSDDAQAARQGEPDRNA